MRLDKFLVTNKHVSSRERAKERIVCGDVSVNGIVTRKSAREVSNSDTIIMRGKNMPWVSRGGEKLEKALQEWDIDISGKTCLDIGASTGGFTEVLLSHGAKKVYALDVEHGQLHKKIRDDDRVINMKNTNIKDVSINDFDEPIECVVIDVSFISLQQVLPCAVLLLESDGTLVALIKPQFEVGKENIKKGIVNDEEKHDEVVANMQNLAKQLDLSDSKVIESPIKGGDGNKEFLLYARKASKKQN